MWIAASKDKMAVRSLKASDYVTTTGTKLQQVFRNFNNNVRIFRNQFDWEQPQWKLKKKEDDGFITIGWVGLTSHFEDIKKMVPIMKYFHDKYPNTKFLLAGMAIKDTEVEIQIDDKNNKNFIEKEVTDEKNTYRYKVKQLFAEFDQNRVQFLDAVNLENYGKFYTMLDISLCFVEKNTFTQCKSEIKAVESMFYENITISTNWGGYSDMKNLMSFDIKHKNHFVDHEQSKYWVESLEYWMNNLSEGKKYAKLQSEWVKDFYNINKHIDDRVNFYEEIMEKNLDKEMTRINDILAEIH